jgi:hypothetical protein
MDKTCASYKLIYSFIKMNKYTWTVEDVLREYQKKQKGLYVSFTMNEIIKHNETEIKILLDENIHV